LLHKIPLIFSQFFFEKKNAYFNVNKKRKKKKISFGHELLKLFLKYSTGANI
jgi:hypothetical protein